MRRVLFTADDFGLTDGVCAGIVTASVQGVVTRTSAMACVPGCEERIGEWAGQFKGTIGAHLQLTDGRPCAPAQAVRSLTNSDGLFPSGDSISFGLHPGEVSLEWRAQIRFLQDAGLRLAHIDSHHHAHRTPELRSVAARLSREFDLPLRPWQTKSPAEAAARFTSNCSISGLYSAEPSLDKLIDILESAMERCPEDGTIEVVCHPGLMSDDLAARSRYTHQREDELRLLTDSALRDRLTGLGLELCKSYE